MQRQSVVRKKRRRRPVWLKAGAVLLVAFLVFLLLPKGVPTLLADSVLRTLKGLAGNSREAEGQDNGEIAQILGTEIVNGREQKEIEALQELLELNAEAEDFVNGYMDRASYLGQEIDLSADFQSGRVPLLMQWDKRWGYDLYGDSMIGLSGCGPTCLAMAYLYFTEDLTANPRTMAQFAYKNGYFVSGGTSWDLWTEGVKKLGLSGEELPLDQGRMEKALDNGSLIVCSMRPGDFTTTGHFILIYGYDENGFRVNDPNRRSNSEKQWTYEVLQGQIKNLWAISAS